jgi:hypothetical protein
MILPCPQRRTEPAFFGAFDSAFVGIAAIASVSSSVGARGLSEEKLPERSRHLVVQNKTGLFAGYRTITDKLHGLQYPG